MQAGYPIIWKTIIFTTTTAIMSGVIPVDLLAFATNPSYINTLVPTNVTNPTAISLLAYDERFGSVLGAGASARQLHNLDWQAFHEAGVYNRDAKELYVTSNWVGDLANPINVTVIDLANNYSISSTRYSALAEPNGATSYFPPGTTASNSTGPPRVLYCDQGDPSAPASLVSVDPVTGASEKILTSFIGRNFTSLNDVRQHPHTGELWFTDTSYGHIQGFRPEPTIPNQVYRFDPATGAIAVVADDYVQPNGLEFSPDFKTLYVTDTGAQGFSFNGTGPTTVYAYDVIDGKRLDNRRVFAYADSGLPDGVHTDTHGNLWAGCGDGIHVWDPEGTLLGKIWTGVTTNNFAFLPDAVLVFTNAQLWIVENIDAVGREVCKDFGEKC